MEPSLYDILVKATAEEGIERTADQIIKFLWQCEESDMKAILVRLESRNALRDLTVPHPPYTASFSDEMAQRALEDSKKWIEETLSRRDLSDFAEGVRNRIQIALLRVQEAQLLIPKADPHRKQWPPVPLAPPLRK